MLTTRRESGRNPALLLAATALILGALIVALSIAPVEAEAAKKVTVTFNAAGGKIGKKAILKRKVRKGSKVGKLPKAKRTAYAFKGWYTKKTGGKKVTAGTKVRTKTVIWARWKRVLSTAEKQLVGKWSSRRDTPFDNSGNRIEFRADGTFLYSFRAISFGQAVVTMTAGDFALRSGRIIGTNMKYSLLRSSGAGNFRDRPGDDVSWLLRYADRPYSMETDSDAWLNGATWLNIGMHPQWDGTGQWESFQRPDA